MKNSRVWEIVFAVFCAICLWMYVVTVVTPDDDLVIENIPVTFAGESALRTEHNLIITNRSARSVNVTFHGSRVLLKQLEAEKNNISAVLDVSSFTSERDYSSSYEIVLPTMLQNDDIQIVEYSPKVISFTVEMQAKKSINVKGIFEGTVADGYVPGDLQFNLDTILVTGPAELVDQVRSAQVVMSGKNLSRTTVKEIAVTLWGIDEEGQSYQVSSDDLTMSATEIAVTLPIYIEKTLPLTLTPVYGGAENPENTRITIEPNSVTVLGEPDEIRMMSSLSLGELDLTQLKEETTVNMDIPLPDGFILKSGSSTVKVEISFGELKTRTIKVVGIVLENVPDGMTGNTLTQDVEVTFRGTEEELAKLLPGSISLTANLSGYKDTGAFTVPVTVNTDNTKVTALGSYFIRLELDKK